MAETMELLPCPFCGEAAEFGANHLSGPLKTYHVVCSGEHCFKPRTDSCDTKEDAAYEWNTRVPASQSTERDRVLEEAAKFLDKRGVGACERGMIDPSTGVFECRQLDKGECNCAEFDEVAERIRAMQTRAAAHTRSNAADMEG